MYACFEVFYELKSLESLQLQQLTELMWLACISGTPLIKQQIICVLLRGEKGRLLNFFSQFYQEEEVCRPLLDEITGAIQEFPLALLSCGAWKRILNEKWINCPETYLLRSVLNLSIEDQKELVPLIRIEEVPLEELKEFVYKLKQHKETVGNAYLTIISGEFLDQQRNQLQTAVVPHLERIIPFSTLKFFGRREWFPKGSVWELMYCLNSTHSQIFGTLTEGLEKSCSSGSICICTPTTNHTILIQGTFNKSRVLETPGTSQKRNVYTAKTTSRSFVLVMDQQLHNTFFKETLSGIGLEITVEVGSGKLVVSSVATGSSTPEDYIEYSGGMVTHKAGSKFTEQIICNAIYGEAKMNTS